MTTETTAADVTTVEKLARAVVQEHPPAETSIPELMGAWYDAGLSWVHFPLGLGGLDAPRALQPVANAVLREAGGPEPRAVASIGYGIIAGTLRRYLPAQRAAELLRPLATGEEKWCQLFSEPGAGSDLAGLATRAKRDGDGWRVTGQKVWNSLADRARYGVLLTRSDPGVPKHKGLTYFYLDMGSEGVDVRSMRQINGRSHFSEVFLDSVYIPDAQRLGEVGDGWIVANSTLADERTSLGDRVPDRGSGAIGDAVGIWHQHPERQTAVLRDRLARLWMRAETHRLTTQRARVTSTTRGAPGPESAIVKLVGSELTQHIYEWCIAFLGPEAALMDTYDPHAPDDEFGPTLIPRKYLRSRATTIEGGTSEILRNVLGERVLKLPQELRNDKKIPWSDVPRS